jgi:AraC-like DNA-binding protein
VELHYLAKGLSPRLRVYFLTSPKSASVQPSIPCRDWPIAGQAVENLRIEAARLMMEQSRHPIDVIAQQTGFANRDRTRRAFLRAFGQSPQVIRRNARAEAAA